MALRLATALLAAWVSATAALPARRDALHGRAVSSGPVPDYALAHAPIVYLSSSEQHWPSSIETHLSHLAAKAAVPGSDKTARIPGAPFPLTVDNLNDPTITSATYLSLIDDKDMQILTTASWLHAEYGKPDASGKSAAPVRRPRRSLALTRKDRHRRRGQKRDSRSGRRGRPVLLLCVLMERRS